MSNVFSEPGNGIAADDFAIVPEPNNTMAKNEKNEENEAPLAEYIQRVMKEENLTFTDIERIARSRNAEIGKSTIQQIATGKTANPGILTLQEFALGIHKPVEDLITAALGSPVTELSVFRKSDFGILWELYHQLPLAEQRVFKRYLQMMDREMRRVLIPEENE